MTQSLVKKYEPFWVRNKGNSGDPPTRLLLVLPICGEVDEHDISKLITKRDEDKTATFCTVAKYPKEKFLEKTRIEIPETCDYLLVRQFEKDGEDLIPITIPKEQHDGKDFILVEFHDMSPGSKAIN